MSSSFRRKNSTPATSASLATNAQVAAASSGTDSLPIASLSISSGDVNKPVSVSLGFKPSVYNSLGLVSSGHNQLDDLLGGGLQLGTALLLGSDLHSSYADTLLNYGLAEGISMQQSCLLLTTDRSATLSVLDALPFNRTLGSSSSSSSGKNHFCCSYDLSRTLQADIHARNCVQSYSAEESSLAADPSDLPAVLDGYLKKVMSFVQTLSASGAVGRVYVHNLHDILTVYGAGLPAATVRRAAVHFILRLRLSVRCARVAVVISALSEALPGSTGVASSLTSNSTDGGCAVDVPLQALIAVADTALTVDTFAGRSSLVPYEFREFCGFLVVERVQHLGTLVGHRPSALRYGLKRDRRKLHIEFLHLPPEESRAQGSAGTDGRLEERSRARMQAEAHGPGQGLHAAASSALYGADNASPAAMSTKIDAAAAAVAPQAASSAATQPMVASAEQEVLSAAGIPQAPARQYRRLNLGQNPPVTGGVSISKFRKPAATALTPGVACKPGGLGEARDLEF